MVKLLLVTHGNLAGELFAVAQSILERDLSDIIKPVNLPLHGSDSDFARDVKLAMEAFDPMDRVIGLTDVFGGTPSNLVLQHYQAGQVELITGVNLGLLLHLLSADLTGSLQQICEAAKQAGQDAIIVAGEFL